MMTGVRASLSTPLSSFRTSLQCGQAGARRTAPSSSSCHPSFPRAPAPARAPLDPVSRRCGAGPGKHSRRFLDADGRRSRE